MDGNIKILIVGAGELGSRHLQGVLKIGNKVQIFVLDLSENSLKIARQREAEINHFHEVTYVGNWDFVPKALDIVIISTSANVREQVVTKLLNDYSCANLILEKILFQELNAYSRIQNLILEKRVQIWVNHPRRMVEGYKELRSEILKINTPIQFTLVGGNWGLACNALHFIDLFMYLTNTSILEIDTDLVDNIIHKSKRAGYIEITGIVKGRMTNDNLFTINSINGESTPVSIIISTLLHRWVIEEGVSTKITQFDIFNNEIKEVSKKTFPFEFQSTLTTKLINGILENNDIDLPTYEEASEAHIPFIEAVLKKYCFLTNSETKICPIT